MNRRGLLRLLGVGALGLAPLSILPALLRSSVDRRPVRANVGIGDLPVASPDDLQRILGGHAIGQPLVVQVLRGRELVALEVHPTELPDAA